jgi:ankyrin repeat protein
MSNINEKLFNLVINNFEIELLQKLIDKGADVNTMCNIEKRTCLIWAVINHNKNIVQLLIEAGADINIQDRYGDTALILASMYGSKEIVKLLLKANANVNIQNDNGNTALMYALGYDNIKIIKLLVDAGALPIGITQSILDKIENKEIYKLLKMIKKLND